MVSDAELWHIFVDKNMNKISPGDAHAEFQSVENMMRLIKDEMIAVGFETECIKEAQVLYLLALSDFARENGFLSRLSGCFSACQTDAQLLSSVNSEFGTSISLQEFTKIMTSVRAVYISTAGYFDPSAKNNFDLVTWAKNACSHGWGYVWGTYGLVLTQSYYKAKTEQYPDEIGKYAEFIESHWLGGRTADCIGLIKGYGWLNPDTHQIVYATNGMPDINANTMYDRATEKGTIDSMPEIPGLALWTDGHIGIYIGNGQVIHASSENRGVIQTPIKNGQWTHWLKIPYIAYL